MTEATPAEAERLITQQEPSAPSTLNRGIAITKAEWADLDVMCLKALQKDPERRYVSADAFIQDVDAFLQSQPLMARPDSWHYRTGKFLRRRRKAVIASTVAAVLLAGLSGTFVWRLNQARQAALLEAAHTGRLLQFTLSLFGGDSDEAGPPRDLRVIDILDRGVKQAKVLRDDPLRQAELYGTLGMAYRGLGDLGKAEKNLESAWLLRKQLSGPALSQAAESQIALGLVHCDENQYDKAEKEVREGLSVLERLNKPARDDAAVLRGKIALGHVLMERGSFSAAIQLLAPTVEIERGAGTSDTDRASGLFELSSAYYDAGDYARSAEYVKPQLALDRSIYGADHPNVAEDELQLCAIERERGSYAEAEIHCRNGVSIELAWYGPTNPVTASAMNTLAQVLQFEDKNAEARTLLQSVLAIQEAAHGTLHVKVALALYALGYAAISSKHYAEAEQDDRRALQIYRKLSGDHRTDVATTLSDLAIIAHGRGNDVESEALIRQALAIYLETHGPDYMNTGNTHVKLGHLLLSEEKYSAARNETLLGYKILAKQTSPQNEFVQLAQKDLAAENSHLNPQSDPFTPKSKTRLDEAAAAP